MAWADEPDYHSYSQLALSACLHLYCALRTTTIFQFPGGFCLNLGEVQRLAIERCSLPEFYSWLLAYIIHASINKVYFSTHLFIHLWLPIIESKILSGSLKLDMISVISQIKSWTWNQDDDLFIVYFPVELCFFVSELNDICILTSIQNRNIRWISSFNYGKTEKPHIHFTKNVQ